jgi:hypothetical protein
MTGSRSRTVRIIEIAEILGVTHQRTSVIVRRPDFPAPVGREGQSRVWDRREGLHRARTHLRARQDDKPNDGPAIGMPRQAGGLSRRPAG